MKDVIQVPKEDRPAHKLQKEENQLGGTAFSANQTNIKVSTTSGSPIVLRYIPKSQRKEGNRHSLNMQFLKAPPRRTKDMTGLIGPYLRKMVFFHCTKHATTSLPGFVASFRGLLQEEGGLPMARTNEGLI